MIGTILGVVFMTLVNISVVAYNYGKLSQQVADLDRRIEMLEDVLVESINSGN